MSLSFKNNQLIANRPHPARSAALVLLLAGGIVTSLDIAQAATSLRDQLAGSRTVQLDNNVKLYDGWTDLMYAAWRGNLTAVTEILEKGTTPVNAKDEDKRTALSYAAWQGNSAVIRLLYNKGADINHKDVEDITPLM